MTSISGSMSAVSMSPNDRMKIALQSAVAAGSVKSADQSALSSALDDINTAMQSGTTGAATSPTDMKSKVDSLVDKEVSDGKLTSDQATELKQVFAEAAQKMGGHHHGHHVKASDSTDATAIAATDGSSDSSSSTSSGSTDSLTSSIETLISFLKQMEKASSSSTNYTASGSSAGSTASNLLVSLNA